MPQDLTRTRETWLAAEAAGDDDGADTAFAGLLERAAPRPLPSREFIAATMTRVAAARQADLLWTRRVRHAVVWSGTAATVLALYFGGAFLISTFSAALVGGLNLIVSIVVWFAEGGTARSGVWSTLSGMGRAAAAFVAEPRVTVALLGFQAVAAGALVILHRVLGADREWLE